MKCFLITLQWTYQLMLDLASSSNAADHPTLQLQNYRNCRLKLFLRNNAIPKSSIRLGYSLTFQWLFKLLCLHLYDPDTDWYLWLITHVDNQMMKSGKMSLRFSHYFAFSSWLF